MAPLLEIHHLSVSFQTPFGELQAVRDVSLTLHSGEVLAIVGESGCGKSVLCRSIMRLLPGNAVIKGGSILADGVDITQYSRQDMERLRGRLFSMVFQDPLAALNPALPVGAQIAEAVRVRLPRARREAVHARVLELMAQTGIEAPGQRCRLYPHQLSGGMRQRIVLAIALASGPKILFADEPTTSLDVTIQAQLLDLLRGLQRSLLAATVLVSHDLGVVARAADRVAVMYAGKIVEIGTADEIFYDPRHPYTWGLLRALPSRARRGERLYSIPGAPPSPLCPPSGDAFACRNEYALQIDYLQMPPMFPVSETHAAATWLLDERAPKITPPAIPGTSPAGEAPVLPPSPQEPPLLDVRQLSCLYRPHRHLRIQALDGLTFQLHQGEILGLVGESGAGKSTAAQCVMGLCRPSAGQIRFQGIDLRDPRACRQNRRLLQTSRQLIFQDASSSLNGRMSVAELITEPLQIHKIRPSKGSLREEAAFLLEEVGLDVSCLDQYPAELSGGMRQRVAIARALSTKPALLVADEPVASLDVSIQAQILHLFQRLQAAHGFSILFIAHDLSAVRYLCDRTGVLHGGRLVELAPTETLFHTPAHPYTRALLSAIPSPDPRRERARPLQAFDRTPPAPEEILTEIAPGHLVLKRREP